MATIISSNGICLMGAPNSKIDSFTLSDRLKTPCVIM